ncbi:hypothetical protein MFIFM68171_06259 [Madurella fahalii]|uniref:Uncharacterized protein n=1 Tax=Madurella fahalii TaxID=1157608 RepID=A0ABQ0GEF5_9PEZI
MASIGSITAAAATARADTTLALANFNFEVNLFTKRVAPPAEYEGVGKHLAPLRLKEAQDGTQHATARKLGLLFHGLLPNTPELIKAYGTRASEIARSARANPVNEASSYGPFANRVGTDATALWAAATSGRAAIQCHLLVCMLARIWDGPEATSLWVEIILRRKIELAAKLEAEGELSTDLTLAASQQFPRADLADWDASCRSWLRVADSVNSTRQTKLRLIVDNLDLSVNNKPDTYDSVITAWTTAMAEMEKLLNGIPRPVQGDVTTEEVVRYVGDVALKMHEALHGLASKEEITSPPRRNPNASNEPYSWLLLLSQVAQKWAPLLDQPRARTLRTLGRNFCKPVAAPFQNLFTVDAYMDVAMELEDKIRLLREIAAKLDAQENLYRDYRYLIIYDCEYQAPHGIKGGVEFATACPEFGIVRGVVDTAQPRAHRRWLLWTKDGSESSRIKQLHDSGEEVNHHWNSYPQFIIKPNIGPCYYTSNQPTVLIAHGTRSRRANHYRARYNMPPRDQAEIHMRTSQRDEFSYDVIYGEWPARRNGIALLRRQDMSQNVIVQGTTESSRKAPEPTYVLSTKLMSLFRPDLVRFDQVALALRRNHKASNYLIGMTFINELYKDMLDATVDVRAAKVDLSKAHWVTSAVAQHMSNFSIDDLAAESGIDGAPSVGSATTRRAYVPQPGLLCDDSVLALSPRTTDTATCFVCIAMLETGSFNISPSELSSVFALCAANSMYIASSLLRDPAQSQETGRGRITRVTSNIGSAGMVFMIPPPTPIIHNYDLDDWYQYNHCPLDGVLEDCFGGTSLHLSFTEWTQPLTTGATGGRDVEAYFLETLISVYYRDTWIGDLDILSAFKSRRFLKPLPTNAPTCSCPKTPDVRTDSSHRAR